MQKKKDFFQSFFQKIKILLGVFLCIISILALLSLLTWNFEDNSFTYVNRNPVKNLLGYFGSLYSDLTMQIIGLASFISIIPIFFWGIILITQYKKLNFFVCIFLWTISILFFSIGISSMPIYKFWPLSVGLGGILGDEASKIFLNVNSKIFKYIISLIYILSSLITGTYLIFIRFKNPKKDDISLLKRIFNKRKVKNNKSCKLSQKKIIRKFENKKNFELPLVDYLYCSKKDINLENTTKRTIDKNLKILSSVLEDFGVKSKIDNVHPGPVVTLYEIKPNPGIKSSRIINLSSDIARSMKAISARISIISERNSIGIEIPNSERKVIYLREIITSKEFHTNQLNLGLILGKTIFGNPVIVDLTKMPHLLIAGTTGSGKSVGINAMIMSLLYKNTPETCRMIMIDPKMLELSVYEGIPHLLTPVITDPKKAIFILKWAIKEMEQRYLKMSKIGVRNIDSFNFKIIQALKNNKRLSRTIQTGFDKDNGTPVFEIEKLNLKSMPYIVIIIDEIADLMMVAGKEVEESIQRLAQMARASGIHIIMATQRPSVDIITGTIKANFPTRISFSVTSKIDSRTILGEQGAEQLIGNGDMLFMMSGNRIQRIHGPFVCDSEIEKVVIHLKKQESPRYLKSVMEKMNSNNVSKKII